MAGKEGVRLSNSLGRSEEVSVSNEAALEVERRGRGGVVDVEDAPSLEGNGGGGGRRLFASTYWLADGVRGGGSISCCESFRGGGSTSCFTARVVERAAELVVDVDVDVDVRRGAGGSSCFSCLPLAVFHAAEPVLSTLSLKFLRTSSNPQRLRGIIPIHLRTNVPAIQDINNAIAE